MNVVMVCESAEIAGGAEKVAVTTAMELARRGHRTGYFAPRGSRSRPLEAGVALSAWA